MTGDQTSVFATSPEDKCALSSRSNSGHHNTEQFEKCLGRGKKKFP